jgi:dTDP-4-amino-4,6-dideoxygalactose transaminase
MTAAATALAVKRVGAQPRFVDVEFATRGIDPDRIAPAITSRTKAIIVVHLHGIPAQIGRIASIARSSGLMLIEDCAQAHGIRIGGMHVGAFGDVAAFSFYPVKNLGCFGDGGCVATKSETVAALVRRRRFYGLDERKVCREIGFNSRLDEMQAAILRVLLQHLDDDNRARKTFAHFYDELLQPAVREGLLDLPPAPEGCVFHQYALTSESRDRLKSSLARAGVTTEIHYPLALHRHPALGGGALVNDTVAPTADRLASTLLSMPIQPELMIYQGEIGTAFASASRHMRLDPAS